MRATAATFAAILTFAAAGLAHGETAGTTTPQFTSSQAASGKSIYDRNCAACHGGSLEGTNDAPALSGEFFESYWDGKSVGELYDYIHDFMPPTAPSSLEAQEYLSITTYVLSENGIPSGDVPLDLESDLASMIIGFEEGE